MKWCVSGSFSVEKLQRSVPLLWWVTSGLFSVVFSFFISVIGDDYGAKVNCNARLYARFYCCAARVKLSQRWICERSFCFGEAALVKAKPLSHQSSASVLYLSAGILGIQFTTASHRIEICNPQRKMPKCPGCLREVYFGELKKFQLEIHFQITHLGISHSVSHWLNVKSRKSL